MNAVEDLAAWLTAIWDEEERLAKDATPGPWKYMGRNYIETGPIQIDVADWGPDGHEGLRVSTQQDVRAYRYADVAYIAANDPASVLARIAADRKILAAYMYLAEGTGPLSDELAGQLKAYGWAVQYLAEAHRDRPGFRPEWLVERQGVEG